MSKKKAFLLRVQPELWEEISRWAGDEFRSVNGQVEFLLREAVRARRGRGPDDRGARKRKSGDPDEG